MSENEQAMAAGRAWAAAAAAARPIKAKLSLVAAGRAGALFEGLLFSRRQAKVLEIQSQCKRKKISRDRWRRNVPGLGCFAKKKRVEQ